MVDLAKNIQNPSSSAAYPKTLNTKAKRALYDNLEKDEKLSIALDEEILYKKKDDWRGNHFKELELKNTIKKYIQDEDLRITIFELVRNQDEY